MNNTRVITLFLLTLLMACGQGRKTDNNNTQGKITVATYYFPNYHTDDPRILNINCWNECTEGSYLEPDTIHWMDYLNAIKEVFRKK